MDATEMGDSFEYEYYWETQRLLNNEDFRWVPTAELNCFPPAPH